MHRLLRSFTAAAVLLLAAPALAESEPALPAKGPGTVFPTIEAAATDGLAWAHMQQMQSRNRRLSRGGTVVRVADGYTYEPLEVARPAKPDTLSLTLGRDVVAHFHTYPAQSHRIDLRNERHSSADRWVVDHRDKRHRPSFVLTPSLRVLAYYGRGSAKSGEVFVASIAELSDAQMLAAQ